jgi:hypothetical protein
MAASERRPRYAATGRGRAVTPLKLAVLREVSACGILTTRQAVRLTGLSYRAANQHLRDLFDAGLLEKVAVPRAALEPPERQRDPSIVHGSAQDVYKASREGRRTLFRLDMIGEAERDRRLPEWDAANFTFLRHELMVRDMRAFLAASARSLRHSMEAWKDGPQAAAGSVEPDAWFAYRLSESAVMVGLVESDRGTEGREKWEAKFAQYGALFTGGALREAIGYARGRCLAVTWDPARRDRLAQWAEGSPVSGRFLAACREDLERADVTSPVWRVPGVADLQGALPGQ